MMKKLSILFFTIVSISLCVFPSMMVFAGDINAAEQSIIDYCSGTFSYKGKNYQATSSALGSLRAELSEDGRDLTSNEARLAKNRFKNSLAEGIEKGLLVEVPSEDYSDPEDQTDSGSVNEEEVTAGEEVEESQSNMEEDEKKSDEEANAPANVQDKPNNTQNEGDTNYKEVIKILEDAAWDETGSYKVIGSTGGKEDQVLDFSSDGIVAQVLNISDVYTVEAYGQAIVSITTKEGIKLFEGDMPIKSTGSYIDGKLKILGMVLLSALFIVFSVGILLLIKGKKEGYQDERT